MVKFNYAIFILLKEVLALDNQTYDEATNTATFQKRSSDRINCPACGRTQMANRNNCYSCTCKFVYEDEQDSKKAETTVS